jgi:hypothetical protein
VAYNYTRKTLPANIFAATSTTEAFTSPLSQQKQRQRYNLSIAPDIHSIRVCTNVFIPEMNNLTKVWVYRVRQPEEQTKVFFL